MPSASRSADYKFDSRPAKTVSLTAGAAPQAGRRTGANQPGPDVSIQGPPDLAAIEDFLQLLARAVRQFHTYPATSPMCTDAVAACHKVFASLDRQDRLEFRVTPRELILDEIGLGAGTVVEHELTRRLHRARVAALDIDRGASSRDFVRFCGDVVRLDDLTKTKTSFAELLAEHGVQAIMPRAAHRPEVLELGAPPAPLADLVERERHRKQAVGVSGGPVTYLYPPEKGWIRLDPTSRFEAISLIDLAILVEDPGDLATMLLRLTDDDPAGPEAREAALEQKFTDVATLFSALDPRLARAMFEKLARAVLELEPERRQDLLRRTILPGLLDGRAEGTVLRDFPDADLAESLCLLLELETAAPEVLTAALDRLELPQERRETVSPLIDERLRGDRRGGTASSRDKEAGLERFARELIRIDAKAGRSFAEYAAFDLSIDDRVASTLAGVAGVIQATDLPSAQLRCLWSLVRLEPNPTVVDTLLRPALGLFTDLERLERWHDLAVLVSDYWHLSNDLREARPDVADAIVNALATFCGPDRVLTLVGLYGRDAEGREIASALTQAFGIALVPGLVTLIENPAVQGRTRSLVPLMCEHASLLAPALVAEIGHCGVAGTRAILRVLGFAGAGYETTVAAGLEHRDEQTGREALRALARIGTPLAASLVVLQLRNGSAWSRNAAEEALWHFTPAQTAMQVRELLASRDFVLKNPHIVTRLLDRAAQAGTEGLDHVLAELEQFRFRFWQPGLMRIALKAKELRRK